MDDTLKLALRISAVDLFSGVLRRFRNEIVGTGKEAEAMQGKYDAMVRNVSAGLKALSVASYGVEKLKPAVGAAMDVQTAIAKMGMILQHNTGITAQYNEQMDRLVNNAYAVTNATKDGLKFPAAQVMTVQAQLLQAGVPLSAILERKDGKGNVHHGAAYMTELLAETKGKDPEWVAQNIENLAHSFQIGPDQYGQIADTIAKASQLGTGTLEQLFYNLDQSGAMAHLMGHMTLRQSAILMKDLAPYGESGGNEFNSFLSRLTGGSYRGAKWMAKSGLDFYDKGGNFIGLDAALEQISTRYGAGKVSQKEFNTRLGRAFGMDGIKVLDMLLAPSAPGVKSYPEMKAAFDQQAGLVAQNSVISGTQEFQTTKFQSGMQNLASSMFAPLVKAMTAATKGVNSWTDALAESARKHKTLDKLVSYGSAGVVGGLGVYGGYKLLRGGASALPFLKRLLRGGGSTAVGVAEGKLLEKVAGVTPVFVTNWPAGGIGGGLGKDAAHAAEHTVEKEAAAAAGGGFFSRMAARLGLTGLASSFAALGGGGAAGAGIASIGLTGAAAGGYLTGHEISKHFIENHPQRSSLIGGTLRTILAEFGSTSAQKSLEERQLAVLGPMVQALHKPNKPTKLEGTIRIQIDQAGRAKVSSVHTDQSAVHLEVGYLGLVP